jgi:hypothetical protein
MIRPNKKSKEKVNNPLLTDLAEISNAMDNSISFLKTKTKAERDKEYYQKHAEQKKQARRLRYQQSKENQQTTRKEARGKYYGAEAYKVLMSLKQYTELNQHKKKL